MPGQLMLDPSLFLSVGTLRAVQSAWHSGMLEGVLLPASFVSAVRERRVSEKTRRFFGVWGRPTDFFDLDVYNFLREIEGFVSYKQGAGAPVEDEFANRLRTETRDSLLSEILLEEWAFLNTRSWIASRVRRPFASFIRAGGVAIELGGKVFDHVVART